MATARQAREAEQREELASLWSAYVDREMEHGALLERVKTGLSLAALRAWRPFRRRIIDAARRLDSVSRRGQAAVRQRNVEQIIERMVGHSAAGVQAARAVLLPELQALAKTELRFNERNIERLFPRVSLDRYDARTVSRIVKTELWGGNAGARSLDEWFTGISDDAQRLISTNVKAGVISGQTTPQILKRLNKAQGGVLSKIDHNLEALAHTATAAVSSAVAREVNLANSDLITHEIWSAALDLTTCNVCGPMDQERWKTGTGPYPPIHPRCRCRRLPEPVGLDLSLTTRATQDGPVKGSSGYEDWLKTKSVAEQNKALGKKRAEMWREGRIKTLDPRTLLDANYRPISVRDLDRLLP